MREKVNLTNPYENVRFEYFYTNDTDLFTTLVTYSVDYGTAELVPYQKVEYVYDQSGNPVEQTFFYWNNSDSLWLVARRETASFDELDRQTSYFKYVPNDAGDELIGSKGETYIYVGDTMTDAEVDFYIWENDDWLKYQRQIYTYEDGLLINNDFLFWNREKGDWSGNDEYNGYFEVNLKNDYTYDAERRLISLLGYDMDSEGNYSLNYEESYTYSPLDNGDTEVIRIQSYMWAGPFLSPYTKEIQHINVFGSETYFKQFTYYTGAELAKREEVRDLDANNIYHGLTIYAFTNDEANTRYGTVKEEMGYPADWNGVSATPSYGIIYKGVGVDTDTSWTEDSMDEYEWHDEVMTSSTRTEWVYGEPRVEYKWFIEFDFSCPASEILKWPLNLRGEDEYKMLTNISYYDNDLDGKWDSSGVNTFYYSDITSAGIATTGVSSDAYEVEIYDLAGHRLATPVKGINIVKYSDGSVRKLIVR